MGYTVVLKESVRNEVADARRWYKLKQKGLGGLLMLSIEDTLKILAKNPFQYMRVYKDIRRAIVKPFPYNLYYQIDDDVKLVEIIAFRHQARDSEFLE